MQILIKDGMIFIPSFYINNFNTNSIINPGRPKNPQIRQVTPLIPMFILNGAPRKFTTISASIPKMLL